MGKMYSSMVNSGVDEIEFTTLYPKIPEDTWRYLKGPESPFWGFYPDPVTIETCQQDLIKYSVACWLSRPRADGWPDPNLTNGDVQFLKRMAKNLRQTGVSENGWYRDTPKNWHLWWKNMLETWISDKSQWQCVQEAFSHLSGDKNLGHGSTGQHLLFQEAWCSLFTEKQSA